MDLKDLGISRTQRDYIENNNIHENNIARVIRENRERYIISTGDTDFEAEITGNMRFAASSREDFPAVGDWVTMIEFDPGKAIINGILPRKSLLARQATGKTGEKQLIAANVDTAFIMQSVDNNFNINRIERYLTICNSGGIEPVVLLSKTDLVNEELIEKLRSGLEKREKGLKYFLLSSLSGEGLDHITGFMQKGRTYCIMGSSGVGKSTLINRLFDREILDTNDISKSTNKGKHTTTFRELFITESGSIIIDTPGMRELGLTDDEEGIHSTFEDIEKLAVSCRFSDCTHTGEKGCAVTEAVENRIIDSRSLDNYLRMKREQEHYNSTVAERRKKDRQFGKMVKEVLKEKKGHKY